MASYAGSQNFCQLTLWRTRNSHKPFRLLAGGTWQMALFYLKFHCFVSEGRQNFPLAPSALADPAVLLLWETREETRSLARYDAGLKKLCVAIYGLQTFLACAFSTRLYCSPAMLIDARKTFAFLSAFYMRTWLLKIIPSKSTLSLTFACSQNFPARAFGARVYCYPIEQRWYVKARISECLTMRGLKTMPSKSPFRKDAWTDKSFV